MPKATVQARPALVETRYYDYEWNLVTSRESAAFAIHIRRGADGRVAERTHDSYKPHPTKSTDPKTGSHHGD